MRFAGSQSESAAHVLTRAGVGHGSTVEGMLVVGYSSHEQPAPVVGTLHFCPSSVSAIRRLREGNGRQIPVSRDYKFCINGPAPQVRGEGLLQVQARIYPNGVLNVTLLGEKARFLPTPGALVSQFPHCHRGGAKDFADYYGMPLDEAFEKYGSSVLLV